MTRCRSSSLARQQTNNRVIAGRLVLLISALAAATFFGTPGDGVAQKKAAPLGPIQAPNLAMPLPMGMQRGTTLDLTLTGTNLADPIALLTSIPGAKATFPPENNNGKDNAKLLVRLEVPKEAPLGFHTLRLASARGMSNLRLFCVDELPQVLKDGKNTTKATAQAVPIPCTVVGQVAAETTDYYKITAQANQRISFDVLGRRLGSPFDPQLAIIDPRNQREVAFSNDAPGLQTDPRLTHTFKEAGEYLIEIRDVMYRGGADFVYRLRIGDFPCATTPVPMAGKRGSKVSVKFAGPAVEGVEPVEVTMPTDPALRAVWVAPKGASGLHGWPVALSVSDIDEVVEQEPNNELAKANRVPVPGAVTGRFEQRGDVDYYVFALKKGKYAIEAQTLELYSPTEVYMVLKNAQGGELAKTNPMAAPRIDFTAPADGDYYLHVEHLHFWGGPSETYRVSVTPAEPGFDVTLASDRLDVPQGSAGLLAIQTVVRRDYTGPIELTVVGHPGITGTKILNPGPPPQPNQPVALLPYSAAPDVPMGGYIVRVQAKATINGKTVVSYASVRPVVALALAGLPFPPLDLNDQVAAAVTEKPPFTLTAKFDLPEGLRGGSVPLTIMATRSEGFDDEIVLAPLGLPANVTPALKNIPKGMNEVKVELKTAANAALGEFPVSFTGRTRFKEKDFSVTAMPVPLVLSLPFALKTDTAPFKIEVGAKAKLKVIAERKGGYKGPIAVEIKGLPANLTAAKATIEMDKDDVEIEVAAAANAAPGDKADVTVTGTATAAANQLNASPNFTVSVQKK